MDIYAGGTLNIPTWINPITQGFVDNIGLQLKIGVLGVSCFNHLYEVEMVSRVGWDDF